jgi:hypothetical protein
LLFMAQDSSDSQLRSFEGGFSKAIKTAF